jgi:DNA-binding NtrC family response regulator
LGHGATFKIYFPAVCQDAKPGLIENQRHPLRGDETILLVEDDNGVRALSRSVLEIFGYTVLETSDPNEAIRISESYRGPFQAILTDIVMPHMNGRRLSELLHPQRPQMRALFMSGYTDDATVRQGILDPGISFIQKPFTPTSLAGKLRDVLDSTAAFVCAWHGRHSDNKGAAKSELKYALVVDDEPAVRKLTALALTNHGFACDEAENGDQALLQFDQREYAVLVTDLRMPQRNGHSLAVEVLGRGENRPLIVVRPICAR